MRTKYLMLCAVVLASLLAACQPTEKPIPTVTIAPTVTTAPTDAPEPAPTATLEPTEPVLAAIGTPVSSANWELTVIDIALMEGNVYDPEVKGYFLPDEGSRFVAVGLKAKPLGSTIAVPIGSAMISDENGQSYGAYFYGSQDATSGEVDPFTVAVNRCVTLAIIGGSIDIPSETYLHMIYQVPETSLGKELTFMFDDVIPVAFTLE